MVMHSDDVLFNATPRCFEPDWSAITGLELQANMNYEERPGENYVEPADTPEDAQFYSVYASTKDGEPLVLSDFDTPRMAELAAEMMRELARAKGVELPPAEWRTQWLRDARKQPVTIVERLEAIELELFDKISDAQDEAEERHKREGLPFDDVNEDGEGIIYPENAAPSLDLARSLVREALDALREEEGRAS